MSKNVNVNLGQLTMTSRVSDHVEKSVNFYRFVFQSIKRHKKGDWGDCSEHDKQANNLYQIEGGRLISVYKIPKYVSIQDESKIWIITEGDRSYTTVLFPSDY